MNLIQQILLMLYNSIKPPGHPIHLDHIIAGHWSNADRTTLRYHLKKCKNKLEDNDVEIMNRILYGKKPRLNDSETETIRRLKNLIEENSIHISSTYLAVISVGLPLYIGFFSMLVLFINFGIGKKDTSPNKLEHDFANIDLQDIKLKLENLEHNQNILRSTFKHSLDSVLAKQMDLINDIHNDSLSLNIDTNDKMTSKQIVNLLKQLSRQSLQLNSRR